MTTPPPSFENYDAYIDSLFAREDNILQGTREEMQAAGLRPINVSPTGGRLLQSGSSDHWCTKPYGPGGFLTPISTTGRKREHKC